MPRRRLWASSPLLLLLLLFAPAALAVVEADFSFYPANAQPCLNQAAAASKCIGSTVTDLNNCLCGNWNDFVILAATCIGKNDKEDSVPVYKTMVSACADSDTPLDVSPSEFYGAVNGETTTTTTTTSVTTTTTTAATTLATATTTTTDSATTQPTSSSTAAPTQGSLSTGATIGIALGASFGGVGSIAGLVYFLLRRAKKQDEERHPMLPPPQYYGDDAQQQLFSGRPPAPEPTPSPGLLSNYSSEVKQSSSSSLWVSPLQSPDYRYSAATWDGAQGAYQGPLAPTEVGSEMAMLPLQAQGLGGVEGSSGGSGGTGMVFEMDATASQVSQVSSGAVEVPGSVPSGRPAGR
ncbi:uncharacterized protein TRIREDRAFT_123680 [Trichoderma reesei QM6a]|jgi:hypothetical protein|uniref:Predicted protein n=1 Tax=Hypocrea jecorina (strain QM6a) TaxID=431241 RepID=G0RU65_HYPJQ|nr:uncharacterized protein TRIREDRAFT_123680 [Trichoderma reesei QM6a]EGR45267.1 predicted protein [Trichoderma reesei QM6a]